MILIPGGYFQMGASADSLTSECDTFREGCQKDWFLASEPVHTVLLSRYYIDVHEVTNEAYVAFMNETGGSPCLDVPCLDGEQSRVSFQGGTYAVTEEFSSEPVSGVTWFGASAYCVWRGARLPTEAEWEKAAAWDNDGGSSYRYPWGNDFDGELVNFCDASCDAPQANADFNDGFAEIAPVASLENGRSPEGLYDMAGNLWEWVVDWYALNYYAQSAKSNPSGPADGQEKVVRGGSWYDTGNFTASAIRFPSAPDNADKTIGFRCAADIP